MGTVRFSEIIGHERPRAFFAGVERTGRLPTGFLLHGARGRGKGTFARAWVRDRLCGTRDGCGHCLPCRRHDAGNHADVESVGLPEGKTRIGIAQLRALREWFHLAPMEADRRYAIIDDAHLMTEEAQNSLLKLLEEPPGAGLLLLVSPEPGSLLTTVRSRVQRVYFGPIGDAPLADLLIRLTGSPRDRVEAVLPMAQGSVGRAVALLDDETAEATLEAARAFFDPDVGPFELSERLVGGDRKGGAARLSETLATALELATWHLEARCGARTLPPAVRLARLETVPMAGGESILSALLEGQGRLQSHVAPRAIVESVKISIQRHLGRKRP